MYNQRNMFESKVKQRIEKKTRLWGRKTAVYQRPSEQQL